MPLNKRGMLCETVLLIFNCLILIYANDTKSKMDDTSESVICENYTSHCYSEHSTDTVPLDFSNITTELPLLDTASEIAVAVTTKLSSLSPLDEDKQENIHFEKPCDCDSVKGVCDINCCCDKDCSKWEKDAFSKCILSNPIPSLGNCVSMGIIYKNNTPYPIVKSEDGFFCIARDNFPERNLYLEQGIIKSNRMFEKIWRRKKHYYWKIYHPVNFISFIKTDKYKYGDPVWMFFNSTGTVQQLTYPSPLASSLCGQEKAITFLNNFKSNCVISLPLIKEQCVRNSPLDAVKYHQSRVIVASPSLINNTYNLEESPDEAFIIIDYELCRQNRCHIVDSIPHPIFNKEKSICENVITKVELELKHNGSRGITAAKCRISLTDIGLRQSMLQQIFSVTFPPEYRKASVVFKRSGTPGYRVGLPVITGLLQGDQVLKKSYLTVVSGPNCSEETAVLFGETIKTQCILQVPFESTLNCTRLEDQISKLLQTQKNGDMIGTSGDPDTWLKRPASIPERLNPTTVHKQCLVSTSLTLDFLYSYSGSVLQPKANIIGVSSALVGKRFIDCSSSLFMCKLRLVSIVSFTDVSQPAMSKFATPPVVKIKLPQDFFYPFSASISSLPVHRKRHLSIMFISTCYMIFQQVIFL